MQGGKLVLSYDGWSTIKTRRQQYGVMKSEAAVKMNINPKY